MNKPNLQSDSALYSLMLGAENELRKLRYSDSTIRHRWEVWKRYLKFSNKEDFQLQDWHDFLKKVYGIEELQGELTRKHFTSFIKRAVCSIGAWSGQIRKQSLPHFVLLRTYSYSI